MSAFNLVEFGPDQIKAVMNGTANRSTTLHILTSQTCGEPCWHALEEICRCSCGGRNHGCLSHGGEKPERTCRINGLIYKLNAVGEYGDLTAEADRINREAGYSYIDKPTIVIDSMGAGYTEADAVKARCEGKEVWYSQYYGVWKATDCGAPARIKYPSANQRNWQELSGWKDSSNVALLWTRLVMPERPKQLKVGRDGIPLTNQFPTH